jgi:hypothetical protein
LPYFRNPPKSYRVSGRFEEEAMRNSTVSSRVLNYCCIFLFALINIAVGHAQGTDVTPPNVVSIDFTPTAIVDSAGTQPVTFTVEITDNSSGFQSASWRLVSPSANHFHSISITATNRISGSSLNGIYQAVYSLPAHSEVGTWHVAGLRVVDAAGNVRAYDDMPIYSSPAVFGAPLSRVFTGDFNHDGIEDITVISTTYLNPSATTVSVYLGSGNGVFGPTPSHSTTVQEYANVILAPSDFNGDGNSDVAFQEVSDAIWGTTPVYVLLGNGDGTFQALKSAGALPYSAAAVAATVGDFDGDGRSDIVGAGNWGGLLDDLHNGIIILWGGSDGEFERAEIEFEEGIGANSAMLAADANGDGRPDLIWARNGLGKFVVMPGQGNRSFGSPIEQTSAGTPSWFSRADFDSDGNPDLAVIYNGQIGVLLGNGDGSFQSVIYVGAFDTGQVLGSSKLMIGDFDRDGMPDIAADQPEGITLLLNNGEGTFRRYAVTAGLTEPHTYDEPMDFGFADFNNDGLTDFVAGWVDEKVGVYLGQWSISVDMIASSTTSTLGQDVILTATVTPSSLKGSVAFYDGESVLGAAVLSEGQAVFVTRMLDPGVHSLSAAYRGTLLGLPARFSQSVSHTVSGSSASQLSFLSERDTGFVPFGLEVGDFNHDGNIDLVAASGGISFSVFLGNGNGTLQSPVNYGGGVYMLLPHPVVVGDLNSDGNSDVGISGVQGTGEYKGNADGTFTILNGINVVPGGTRFEDVNRDGIIDRVSDNYGTISVLLGIGARNGNTLSASTFTSVVANHNSEMALGDFNGDGNLDIVSTTELENSLFILAGNGDGTFDTPSSINPGSAPRSPVAADFNADGNADLALIQSGSGTIRILLGNGNGAFPTLVDTTVGGTLIRMIAKDLDGDGTLDLAVLSTSLDRVLVLPGNGNGTFGTARMYYAGSGLVDLVATDFNDDGKMDLAVASSSGASTGKLFILQGVSPSASSISLSVTPVSSSLSQQVTMTATVSPSGSGGWVTFYDGATILGSIQVSGVQAVLHTRLLGSGAHLLRAVFSGDGTTYNSSVSDVHIQKVTASSVFAFGSSVNMSSPSTSYDRADFNNDGIMDFVVKNNASLTALLGQGTGQFVAAAPMSVYSGSAKLVTADFNRDGNADVLLNAWGTGGYMLLGKGDGTCLSPSLVSGLTLSGQLKVADVNADGAPDLLDPGNSSGNSFVLLNRGNGTFESPIRYDSSSSDSNFTIVGDLNGDGRADLVMPDSQNGYVKILIGKGDGTFQTPVQFPTVASPMQIVIADFNADGIADLAVANSIAPARIGIMVGIGDGTFENWGDAFPGNNYVNFLVTCDCDGDGKTDLLTSGNTAVRLLRGLGDGTFQDGVDYATIQGQLMFVEDLNLDGRPDLISYEYNSLTLWLRMAVYASSVSVATTPNPVKLSQTVTLTATLTPGDATGTVAFYDDAVLLGTSTIAGGHAVLQTKWLGAGVHKLRVRYSGDPLRYVDSVSANVGGTVRSGRSSGFGTGTTYATARGPLGVAAGDLNKDGKQDIIVANGSSNTVSVLLGNGSGGFAARVSYNVGSTPAAVAVLDLNRDGNPDIAVGNSGGNNVSVLLGNGDGTVQTAVNYSMGASPVSIVGADLNGDGLADLIVGTTDGVYALLGTASTLSLSSIGTGVLSGATAADVNNDGRVDVPVMGSGSVWVRIQAQNGTFSNSSFMAAGTTPSGFAVGDYNGDGNIDIATANTGSNNASVILGNGNGTFQPAVSYGAGTGPVALVTTDYNGDGKSDLVVVNGTGNSVTLLKGKGDGTFFEGIPVATGGTPAGVAAGDFNGDGVVDLAVTNSADNTVSVYLGKKSAVSNVDFDGDGKSSPVVYRSGIWYVLSSSSPGSYLVTQWGMAGDVPVAGDYDGDGTTDIAVWRPSNGIWYILPSATPGSYIATQWGIQSDVAVPGDYDGDGKTDIAVWRPSNGVWYVLLSGTPGSYTANQWGLHSDAPVSGDFDGDGKTDVAVWRPSSGIWYVQSSGNPGNYTATQWGLEADIPVPGDFDGDGNTDIAVWRADSGIWYQLPSGSQGTYSAIQWGVSDDRPVPGDFDGDGKIDIAVWRPESGIWYVRLSSSPGAYTAVQWGVETDLPIPNLITGDD